MTSLSMGASGFSMGASGYAPVKTPATTSLPTATPAMRAKIDATAKKFESQFLSVMLGQMFKGTDADAPFGGGQGEQAFKSFMTDAFAKSVANHGGVGLAKNISKDMLRIQGLS